MKDNFEEFVCDLIKNRESEYVEFKTSNDEPNLFEETASALANGAVLAEKSEAYLVYGVDDESHKIVGTEFDPYRKAKNQPFINLIATDLISESEVFELIDFTPYYNLREAAVPDNRETILETMANENVVIKKVNRYYVTNLGALLFARKMTKFKTLINRGIRVIRYRGSNKIGVERSFDFDEGYALCLGRVFDTIKLLMPSEEYMDGAQRKERCIFSDDIIRELLANIMIHQDFGIDGYCPRVEIYGNRIEFTNSGEPIIKVNRFLDLNRSRNEKLARLARFIGICEERGMGIDKVEYACEKMFLPSPMISAGDGVTRVVVYG